MSKPLLARVQDSNESWFHNEETGSRFRGVKFPVNPTQLPTSVFVLPRVGLRVRLNEPVRSGELIRDQFRRVFLVADHDLTLSATDPVSRVHAMFAMTRKVSWRRDIQSIDPVTLQPRSEEPEDLGMIWVSIESYTHTDNDSGLRIQTDRLRCITNKPLILNDVVDQKVVKRVQYTLGIYISEIE